MTTDQDDHSTSISSQTENGSKKGEKLFKGSPKQCHTLSGVIINNALCYIEDEKIAKYLVVSSIILTFLSSL